MGVPLISNEPTPAIIMRSNQMSPTPAKIEQKIAGVIHRGKVTHHHDHVATAPSSASLSVRKMRKTTVPSPKLDLPALTV